MAFEVTAKALGLALGLLAGITGSNASARSITIALGSEPSTLDPQLRDDGGEQKVNDNVYETLMMRSPKGELKPGLAVGMPVRLDDTTWQFKLRGGVKFHNGEPFNADAVVASVQRIIDPKNNSEQMAYLSTIKGAKKVDDLTVNIMTSGPDSILPSRMYWMKMVPPAYAAKGDIANSPIGTGPYKFVSWDRGNDIKLIANREYWGDKAQVNEVTYRFVSEPGSRLSGLMSGEFDVIISLPPEYTSLVPKYSSIPGLETSLFVLGIDNEVTKDPKVRQALNLAIDRKAMLDSLFMGHAAVTSGVHTNPAAFGFNEKLKNYPFDMEKARTLIREAGAVGKQLVVTGPAGRWVKDREQIEAVASYWSEAGLKVSIDIKEFSQYLKSLFGKPRPDAIFMANSNELLDVDRELSMIYHKDGAAASNSDKEMATVIDAARIERDAGKRKALYDDVQKKGHDMNYTVPLFNLHDIYGMSKRMVWQPRVDSKLIVYEMRVTE